MKSYTFGSLFPFTEQFSNMKNKTTWTGNVIFLYIKSFLQQSVFLRWLNWRLEGVEGLGPVTDLTYDLRSGVVLHHVVAALNGQPSLANAGDSR